jgi:phosphoglycolate phosphatase-like HAD superfamily hydrolase
MRFAAAILLLAAFHAQFAAAQQDPLPSWNDGSAKKAIVDFVAQVTTEGGPNFVPISERIATFDNDGTLWVEMPMYTQFVFAIDRVRALASKHPEWKTEQPFAAAISGDAKTLTASGEPGIMKIMAATHTGITTEQFATTVSDWMKTAQHPRFKRPYTECVYQPMLELLSYLRANGFKTYIVSGGGIEFMRPWTEKIYGIPPEQVIGSAVKTKYQMQSSGPELMRLPDVLFIDDKAGKAEGINLFIGRRPIAAFGNSDGDQQMLEWTAAGSGKRLMLLVHHTDAEREYAYDRESTIGRLNTALDEAKAKGWIVVDMKQDWKTIFPPAKP